MAGTRECPKNSDEWETCTRGKLGARWETEEVGGAAGNEGWNDHKTPTPFPLVSTPYSAEKIH